MAGPIVHKHFLKECLSKTRLNSLATNNLNIYAQGHDLLLYIEVWNFIKNRNLSLILSNFNFQEFIYNYLKSCYENDKIFQEPELKMFLYGYISHHILDSYFHPFIMQYAKDYLPIHHKPWLHGKIETLYDTKFILEKEQKHIKDYKIHQDFEYLKTCDITPYIDQAIFATYNISNGGQKITKAFQHISKYMYLYRYDPENFKQKFATLAEHLIKMGANDFFYDESKLNELCQYMNLDHQEWLNEFTKQVSNDSFHDIYINALNTTCNIIAEIDSTIEQGSYLTQKDLTKIVPNVSAITGDKCNRPLKYIKYRGK